MAKSQPAKANGSRSAVRLAPLPVPKASDVFAGDLRRRILDGDLEPGVALPNERALAEAAGLSRTTVREALRILEVQGLIRIKTGRSGGAFVQKPGKEAVASTVGLLIRGREIRMDSLLETRESIEPHCARLAAKYRTDEDLERLEAANAAIAEEGSLADFLQANVDWHIGVAVASHNELLTGFMLALSRAIYASTDNKGVVEAEVRATTVRAHRSITKAINDKDPEAAQRRMGRHVHAYAEAVLEVDERTAIEVD